MDTLSLFSPFLSEKPMCDFQFASHNEQTLQKSVLIQMKRISSWGSYRKGTSIEQGLAEFFPLKNVPIHLKPNSLSNNQIFFNPIALRMAKTP